MAPSKAQAARHREIRKEWRAFRRDHLFTQKQLAEQLGVSRRAVQYVEAPAPKRACLPSRTTQDRFRVLKAKFEGENAQRAGGSRTADGAGLGD